MMKLFLELSEDDRDELLKLIDVNLKVNGLNVLEKSVKLFNLITTAATGETHELTSKKKLDEKME